MARGKADRSEGRIALILLSALSLGIVFAGRDAAQQRRAGPLLAAEVQTPVAYWVGRPFRAIETTLANAEDRRRAIAENAVLREELATLRRDRQRLAAMQARLERLEATLDLRVNGGIPEDTITARVVADPGSPFVRSYLLAAGRRDGVREGYAVISEDGLVGHIVSAGERSARVLRLDDLNSRVAVMSARSEARAILAGANDGPPALRFVSDPEGWQAGDGVVTSGDDGRLPQGLHVGERLEDGRVALSTARRPIDWVMVVPFAPVADENDVESSDEAVDADADAEADVDAVAGAQAPAEAG